MADDLQTIEVKKVIRTTKKKKKVTIEGDPIQSDSRSNSVDQGTDREVPLTQTLLNHFSLLLDFVVIFVRLNSKVAISKPFVHCNSLTVRSSLGPTFRSSESDSFRASSSASGGASSVCLSLIRHNRRVTF
jgi:hypothetical protein